MPPWSGMLQFVRGHLVNPSNPYITKSDQPNGLGLEVPEIEGPPVMPRPYLAAPRVGELLEHGLLYNSCQPL